VRKVLISGVFYRNRLNQAKAGELICG